MTKEPRKPRVGRPVPPPPTPPRKNPWDIPPLPEKGDIDKTSTFIAVGQALSFWEWFEGYLGLVYGALVGDVGETSPAMRAYGTISAFGGRYDMIMEAAKSYCFIHKTDFFDDLKKFLDEAKQFATRRNEIAHGIVQPYYVGGLANSGFALGPSRHATRKLRLGDWHTNEARVFKLYAYTSLELRYFGAKFASLSNRAMDFYAHIEAIKPKCS